MSYTSFTSMKPNPQLFRSTYVSWTSESTYGYWKARLHTYNSEAWNRLCERLGEDAQFAVLRAIAVVGINDSDWVNIFTTIYDGRSAFRNMSKEYLEGKISLNWTYFASKLAKEGSQSVHYPPLNPEWLYPYGYTQQEYLHDLGRYWHNIHDDYY